MDALVQGSVLWIGDRVRINVQLVEAATDRHLWAKSYDRHLDDILALQKEACAGHRRRDQGQAHRQEQARLAEVPRVLPAAYLAYRKGCYFLNKRTELDLKTAISRFTEATDADPTYAPAWAGLADCYSFLGYGNYLSPKESFPKAEAAAARHANSTPISPTPMQPSVTCRCTIIGSSPKPKRPSAGPSQTPTPPRPTTCTVFI